jgi:prolyl oligopeptidase
MPYGVVAIPDYQAPAAAAHYASPAKDGSRAGFFYAKTYKPEEIPNWTMDSLVMHEAVPGHHLQLALAQENPNIPDFRSLWVLSAYSEGWGLYAESLGDEIGFYKTPYARFGKLNSEIFRACRLVIDTGMHSLGWTRQQAIDYFIANTGLARVSEVDRYIAWPGQALSYKIGELKIKELRAKAEKQLGPRFDVREFHDVILGNGALPLDLLEQQVDVYLKKATLSSSSHP